MKFHNTRIKMATVPIIGVLEVNTPIQTKEDHATWSNSRLWSAGCVQVLSLQPRGAEECAGGTTKKIGNTNRHNSL